VRRYRQFCALARAAELLGERWTLLIVRELLLGPKRFADVGKGLKGISPALLTERLARMEQAGLVRRALLPPPARIAVYELTEHGHALRPAVLELIRWGGRFLFPPRKGDMFEPEWMRLALEACARKGVTPPRAFQLRVVRGSKHADVRVIGGRRGTRVSAEGGPVDATVVASAETIFALASGSMSGKMAVERGLAQVAGDAAALVDLPVLFDMSRKPENDT
jgi:DNA-binding HxlR family transcriptional regulator